MEAFSKVVELSWADIDGNRHLRHSAYADYGLDVRIAWLKQHGVTLKRFAELMITPVYFWEETEYYREIPAGDSVRIDLEVVGVSKDHSRWHFRQHFYRSDEVLAARHEVKGGWFHLATRRLVIPPKELTSAVGQLKRSDDYADITALPKKKRRQVSS